MEKYMNRALSLALKGVGSVSTNPMVGAVIVAEGRIIGEGYHQRCGEAHAEVNAVRSVREEDKKLLASSTMYVTLEPCCHYGKTPPCTELILSVGIPRVVIAMQDPFAKVDGAGIARLRDMGVEVVVGLLEEEARFINRRFITYHEKKRPYIILKWAETCDGYIDTDRAADEPAKWLTGYAAKCLVHRWRAEEDAIFVGANTVLRDNPSLTVREWRGQNPIRVTIDERDTLPYESAIFNDEAETLCYNYEDWGFIMDDLHGKGVQSLFVEGGAATLNTLIEMGLVDEIRRFISPLSLADLGSDEGLAAPSFSGFELREAEYIGNVRLEHYFVKLI